MIRTKDLGAHRSLETESIGRNATTAVPARLTPEDLKELEKDPIGVRYERIGAAEGEELAREREIELAMNRRFAAERRNRGSSDDY
jgi:hypothetical protein